MRCTLAPARLVHVGPIATKMREMDVIECRALGRSPKEALRNGLRCSQDAWTILQDGRPIAMMGVVSDGLLARSATVWFLGTDEVFQHARDLMFYGPLFFDRWLTSFNRLHNIVAVDNVLAIRLLSKWGYEFRDDRPVHGGVTFMEFYLKRAGREVNDPLPMSGLPLTVRGITSKGLPTST